MDNANPIKYSDLIQPDDSITKLIGQLDELIAKYGTVKAQTQAAAADMVKSMQSLSGATDEQRKEIASLATESEKLTAAYRKSNDAESETYRRRQEVIAAVKEQQRIDKLIVEINNSKEGSYNRLSAQYRLNKIRLNEMSQAEIQATEAGRALLKETNDLYEEMNAYQMSTGKATLQVGHYERALGNLLGVNPKVVGALTNTKQATSALGGAIKALASPIGIAIGAIGALVAVFKLFKDSIHETQATGDQFDYAMGGLNATLDVFKKSISTMDFSGFITGASEAMQAGRSLKQVLDETFERTNSARILKASMSKENATLEEAMRDQGKTLQERIAAGQKYLDNMEGIYKQEEESAKRNRDAQLEYLFSVTNRTKYATDEEREAAKQRLAQHIKDYNLNEESIKQAEEYIKAQKTIDKYVLTPIVGKKAVEELNKAREIVKNADQLTKDRAKVVQQYNLASNKEISAYVQAEENYLNAQAASYNDQKRITTMINNLKAQAAEQAKKAAEQKVKDEQDAAKQLVITQRNILNAELQSIQLQIAATKEGSQEQLDLRLQMIEKQREIEKFENAQKAEELRQDEALIDAKYDAMVLKENAKFNQTLAERDLKAAKDLADAEFELMAGNERQKTLYKLEQEKARLEAILKLDETATEKMTATEVDAIKAQIEAIKKEIGALPYDNLYELLGLKLDKQQQSALDTAIDSTIDAIGSIIDSWQKVADAAVDAADKEVDAAQKALDAQIEARNAGYANDVAMAQKELDLAKKNQQKALAESAKAQKAQIALDTTTQASSLITASANIWKALSGIPVVGPALAVTALATMWGSFAYAKVKAVQATKTEQYGEGIVELLEGGSHASGHDIDLGTKPDGTRRRAEGGEFFAVINKRSSRRYRKVIPDVINALNDGTFSERYQRANSQMAGVALGLMGGGTDVSRLERDVAAIRRQGDAGTYIDAKGNTIIRYRNLTRKIVKS